ncbi:MAG: hypothetical protein AAFP76_11335 [Bacteroidota bacterium]
MTGQKRKYKTSKLKTFLFFLLLALVFWTLTKLSKESTATINTYLAYTNLPSMVSVSKDSAKEISFDLSANGFALLSYKLKEPTLEIDVSKYYVEGDTLVKISNVDLEKIISGQLDNNSEVSNLSFNGLEIGLDVIVSKKVPVEFMSELGFKNGYKLVKAPELSPDSVLVSGPSEAVMAVNVIRSDVFVAKNISDHREEELRLIPPANNEITLSEETVAVLLTVEEFTQKQITLPVEMVNPPKDVTIKLIPETISVSFDVSVSRFNSISANDFRVVCDYRSKSSAENIMVPKLIVQPEGLYRTELSTKKIEYLIFK